MKEYYVYEYRHPITKIPFYVGKGAGRRYLQHLTKTHNADLEHELLKLREDGLQPEIEKVFYSSDEQVTLGVEEHLVRSYGIRSKGGILCNKLDRCFSANSLEISEDIYKLMGTMPDVALAEETGINWGTLRTKRQNRGIPSFKERYKGTSIYSERFLKHKDETITLYNTNGDVVEGNFYSVCNSLGLNVAEVTQVVKGSLNHTKGWYITPVKDKVDKYTIREIIDPQGNLHKMNYEDFSSFTGFSLTSSCNFFQGYSKSLKGWYINNEEGIKAREKARKKFTVYTWVNKDTGEVFEGRAIELEKNYNLTSGCVSCAVNNIEFSCKGWKILKILDNNEVYRE